MCSHSPDILVKNANLISVDSIFFIFSISLILENLFNPYSMTENVGTGTSTALGAVLERNCNFDEHISIVHGFQIPLIAVAFII
jgi:hypothetical protein